MHALAGEALLAAQAGPPHRCRKFALRFGVLRTPILGPLPGRYFAVNRHRLNLISGIAISTYDKELNCIVSPQKVTQL